METTRIGTLALDFADREGARKCEFSKVWNNKLHAVFSDVAPYYDVASDVASLGLCSRWRAKFLAMVQVKPGDKVLDVCAGTNAVGIGLMKRQPNIHAHAIDQSSAMQEVGKGLARSLGFEIESTIGDAHHLPFPDDYFDVVTLQYASRHLRVVDAFTEIRRVLKPGGRFYHCDMLRPESKIVEALYRGFRCGQCLPEILRADDRTDLPQWARSLELPGLFRSRHPNVLFRAGNHGTALAAGIRWRFLQGRPGRRGGVPRGDQTMT